MPNFAESIWTRLQFHSGRITHRSNQQKTPIFLQNMPNGATCSFAVEVGSASGRVIARRKPPTDSSFECMPHELHLANSISSAGSRRGGEWAPVQNLYKNTALDFQIIEAKVWLPANHGFNHLSAIQFIASKEENTKVQRLCGRLTAITQQVRVESWT
jgi:hypothetical protein